MESRMSHAVSTSSSSPPGSVDLDALDGLGDSRMVALLASQILDIRSSIISRIETLQDKPVGFETITRSIDTFHGLVGTLSTWTGPHGLTGTFNSTDNESESLAILVVRLRTAFRRLQELSTVVDDFLSSVEAMRKAEKYLIIRLRQRIITSSLDETVLQLREAIAAHHPGHFSSAAYNYEVARETRPSATERNPRSTLSTNWSVANKPWEASQEINSMLDVTDVSRNAAEAEAPAEPRRRLEFKQQEPWGEPAQNSGRAGSEAISSALSTELEDWRLPQETHFHYEETHFQNDREAELGPELEAVSPANAILEARQLRQAYLPLDATDASLDTTFSSFVRTIKPYLFPVAVATFLCFLPRMHAAEAVVVDSMKRYKARFYTSCIFGLLLLAQRLVFSRTFRSLVASYWLRYMSSLGDSCLIASWTRLGGLFHRWGRPSLPEGCDRTFWTCSCGEILYADFEKQSTPMDIENVANPSNESQESGSSGLTGDTASGNQPAGTSTTRSDSASTTLDGSAAVQEGTSDTRLGTQIQFQLREKSFLLMCVNTGRLVTELSHVETTYIGNDHIFFSNIKAEYEALRSPLRFWSLFIPNKVSLAQFELIPFNRPKGSFVGISEVPSLPPPEFVKSQKLYHYAPCPVNTVVQIRTFLPEQPFRHLFLNPHDCRESWWLNRLPTKLKTKLLFDPSLPTVGWGIHFEEGLNMGAITCLTMAIVLCSWVFSIIWSKLQKDISGGFGTGSFMVSVGTLVLTVIIFYRKELA